MKNNPTRFNRLVYLLLMPMLILLSELACTGTLVDMLVNGQPIFQCPTNIPVIHPTAPPGYPTTIPQPILTPVVIRPPQPFYLGDTIEAGGIRFRLSNVAVLSGTQAI